jgi:anthranilate phosphoribosyltransferase
MAEAAALLGVKRAFVVHGLDGLDEISVAAPSKIVRLEEDGSIFDEVFDPESLGIRGYSSEELLGSDAEGNAALAMDLARGEGSPALKHAVLLNAGAALIVYGMAKDLAEGYGIAEKNLVSGAVLEKIEALRGAPSAAGGDIR